MKAQHPDTELSAGSLPKPGDVVARKYRVDGFIARGGMGTVLAATHQITGRRMALKWVLPDPAQDVELTHRIVREAQAAARVRHPNVVDVYDVGEHDGSMFLVMELLEGETLHARLKAAGALDPDTTLSLILPALRAVEAAHASRVIHRDLKPSNIFLCRDATTDQVTPRVVDFGVSKILAAGDGEHSLTRTGAVIGTPHYMAPEQLRGDAPDARADIYSLGVILYRCLTGQLPFRESNYAALILQIVTATPEPVNKLAPHVPAALSAVVMRAMAREPRDRFPSVTALIAALVPFHRPSASMQDTDTLSAVVRSAPARASRAPAVRWLFALAVCVMIAALAWLNREPVAPAAKAPPSAAASTLHTASAPAAPSPSPAAATVIAEPPPSAPVHALTTDTAREPKAPPVRTGARPRRAAEQRPAASPADAAPSEQSRKTKPPLPISLEEF